MRNSLHHKKDITEIKIKNALNIIFKNDLGNLRLHLISITKVELNKDKSVAKVFWDTYLENQNFSSEILKASSRIKYLLASKVNLRHTPRLDFAYDSQFVEEQKMEKLLNNNIDKKNIDE